MTDVFSRQKRSEIMSRVRSRGNAATELSLIRLFREFKIKGWRRRFKAFGSPDFVFPEIRLAVFIDGCFWHSCPIHGSLPASNRAFWKRKLERNIARDRLVSRELRRSGGPLVLLWLHE